MKTKISAFLILLLAIFNINTAQAQNPHTGRGGKDVLYFNVDQNASCPGSKQSTSTGTEICAEGTVYGLGNVQSIFVTLTVNGSGTVRCYSPGNPDIYGQSNTSYTFAPIEVKVTNGHADMSSVCGTICGSCQGRGINSDTNYDVSSASIYIPGLGSIPLSAK